ncbi:hypothetical protein DPMN_135490 [Dreissena polymorpha]|uniref:Uncharacterized protein n=1 Tax=Dreissena polymorpha TaxID=45954 RepID=A0A9D4JGW7_DREPO|nr:hypothetical protein DPMN_135490 [Dreissena polymorpha]
MKQVCQKQFLPRNLLLQIGCDAARTSCATICTQWQPSALEWGEIMREKRWLWLMDRHSRHQD